MPRWSKYHLARALGSFARKKRPPMPVTFSVSAASDLVAAAAPTAPRKSRRVVSIVIAQTSGRLWILPEDTGVDAGEKVGQASGVGNPAQVGNLPHLTPARARCDSLTALRGI